MNGSKRPGIRETTKKYFGMYRGTVAENDDPKKLCRIRASVPSLLGDQLTGWALPCMPYGGVPEQGFYMLPDVGAHVWIEFEAGDIGKPIWVGTFWEKGWEQGPSTRLIQTQSGHILQFVDDSGNEQIRLKHSSGAGLSIDRNGSVSLFDDLGAKIKLNAHKEKITVEDANGNRIELSDSGILIENKFGNVVEMADGKITLDAPKILLKGMVHLGDEGGEPIIKGFEFLSMFATHIHTGDNVPPMPQGEMSSLSTTVRTI